MKDLLKPISVLMFSLACLTSGCGRDEATDASQTTGSGNSAEFTISLDTGGNVRTSFGERVERRTDMRLDSGVESVRSSRTENDETTEYRPQEETFDAHAGSGPRDNLSLAYEPALMRFESPQGLPQIGARPKVSIRAETYSSIDEARQAFNAQVARIHESTGAMMRGNRTTVEQMQGLVQAAVFAHNTDVHKTLSYVPSLVPQARDLANDFLTNPSTSFGVKVRRAASNLERAAATVSSQFAGAELARRQGLLAVASASLTLADQYYSTGDVLSGEAAIDLALTIIDVASGFVPLVGWGLDVYKAISGYNPILQRELTGTERGFAIFGALTGGIGSQAGASVKMLSVIGKSIGDTPTAVFAVQKAKGLLEAARL